MILCTPRACVALGFAALVIATGGLTACRRKEAPTPPLATPSVTLNHEKTPLGSPIDITYKFVVANDAKFTEDVQLLIGTGGVLTKTPFEISPDKFK